MVDNMRLGNTHWRGIQRWTPENKEGLNFRVVIDRVVTLKLLYFSTTYEALALDPSYLT